MFLLLWLALVGGIISYCTWGIRLMDQTHRDRKRKTYRLNFPADLNPDQVTNFLKRISGTLHGGRFNLTGRPSLVFEVFATHKGIIHRLKIPYGHDKYVLSQLRGAGVSAASESEFEDRHWLKGMECGITNPHRQFRVDDPAEFSASILRCMQSFDFDEALVLQWVVSPAAPTERAQHGDQGITFDWGGILKNGIKVLPSEASKDEIAERRAKGGEANFNTVFRVAAAAQTDSAAESLVQNIRHVMHSARGPSIRFRRHRQTVASLRSRIRAAETPVFLNGQLSATELSAFIAWPMGRPVIAGLAPSFARQMPASASIPQDGRPIGRSTFDGNERPIAVPYDRCLQHMYVLGPNGVGKSTLMANMMAEDMKRGYGVILIESKGDLFNMALKHIPDSRIKDVIVIDIAERQYPVGFNILDQGNDRTAIDNIIGLITEIYKGSAAAITAPSMIYHMLHALAEVPGHTFIDLPTLLKNYPQGSVAGAWQDWLSRQIKRKEVKSYIQDWVNKSGTKRDAEAMPVRNRTWEFTNRDEIRYILGQRKSSFKMSDAILGNKIILVNLRGEYVGDGTASLIGALLVNAIWATVRQHRAKTPNFLYLDEFADFVKLPVGVEAMLSKARSMNLGMVLAHQDLSQIDTKLRSTVLANTHTKILFQLPAQDANMMAREFGGQLKPDDLINLQRFETIVRVAVESGSSPPATVRTYAPFKETGNGDKAWYLSQQTYGRPVEDIERELNDLPGGHVEPAGGNKRPRPPASGGAGFGV